MGVVLAVVEMEVGVGAVLVAVVGAGVEAVLVLGPDRTYLGRKSFLDRFIEENLSLYLLQ